jgi:hypothetical protein
MPDTNFRDELERLINRHSLENGSGTPDFILAHYVVGCLTVFDATVKARDKWWSFEPKIGGIIPAADPS